MKPIRDHLKHLVLGSAVAGGLATGSVQATLITNTYNLGPQDAGTTLQVVGGDGFPGNMVNLLNWVAKGALPAGSILKSISANVRLDSTNFNSWTSDLLIYLDGAPEAPATAALLQIGGDYNGALGTVSQFVGWDGGDNGPGETITQTFTAGVDWIGDIDLNAVQLSLGNNYGPATWSGTITAEYDLTAIPEPGSWLALGCLVGSGAFLRSRRRG